MTMDACDGDAETKWKWKDERWANCQWPSIEAVELFFSFSFFFLFFLWRSFRLCNLCSSRWCVVCNRCIVDVVTVVVVVVACSKRTIRLVATMAIMRNEMDNFIDSIRILFRRHFNGIALSSSVVHNSIYRLFYGSMDFIQNGIRMRICCLSCVNDSKCDFSR